MIITVDFETYYDKTFSLSKLTTEEYVRDDNFEVIGMGVKINDEKTQWFSGSHEETKAFLGKLPWQEALVLAHNTAFDGAILSWRYGIFPKGWLDTLSMARAVHGVNVGGSLKALAEHYKIGEKGTEVLNALGKRRKDFSHNDLVLYGNYCINDVDLTYSLFNILKDGFPVQELKVIDLTLKMFTRPTLVLDLPLLEQHLEDVKDRKERLLKAAAANRDELMSNDKFAELLQRLNVIPPRKISLTTGKETWAFAKTDEGFKSLTEHPDERVQALVSARLGNKTTLEETRTQRFIDIAKRGLMPVPLKYYAAHTGRWGGEDKINLQNLPSRGQNANKLKRAIQAPDGHFIIDADSAQIEARILAWLSEQNDLVEAFDNGEDVYKIMASAIYNKPVLDINKEERFVGKTTILGCLAKGTLVLCDSGWKPIETISIEDRVWDGEEWVCHQGLLNKGLKETLNLSGVWLTPDHKVLCGTQWLEAQSVVAEESTLYQALAIGAENLPLQATSPGKGEEFVPLLLNAPVGFLSTPSMYTTLKTSKQLVAIHARKKPLMVNGTGFIPKLCPVTDTEQDFLIDCHLQYQDATTLEIKTTNTTGGEASRFVMSGATIKQLFLSMFKQFRGGISRIMRWTEPKIIWVISPETYDLLRETKTYETEETLRNYRKKLQTYDLAYSGPRNRFTILTTKGPVIVHNCGYGMGSNKFQAQLKTFGTEISEDEARHIISVYRQTYPKIPALWSDAQRCLDSIIAKTGSKIGRDGVLGFDPFNWGFMLPNGLWQRYVGLQKIVDSEGKIQYEYPTRRGVVKIYGGKIVENLCQALARCVIAEQMVKIAKRYQVVLTVHDAIACIAPETEIQEAVEYVQECMRWRPDWCKNLPLNCEVGYGKNYGET